MEFKWQDNYYTLRKYNLTSDDLNKIIKKVYKRHPHEDWTYLRHPQNDQICLYLNLEFVEYLEEVYFNKNGYYLDLEIAFFEKQILRLEQEFELEHSEIHYEDISLYDLREYFGKSKNAIGVATYRMQQHFSYPLKYTKDGKVYVKAEGVKWLNEKYFRKSYLEELEKYKLALQRAKKIKHNKIVI